MKEMTKKEINQRKNGQRALRAEIRIYKYNERLFGEPSLSKLESLNFDTKILKYDNSSVILGDYHFHKRRN